MQSLQRTIQMIAAQLKGLAPTTKLLIGSLMVILVMSLFLVSLYAGRPSMTPLGLNTALSPDARARVVDYLQTHDIAYEDRGGDLYVPVERKHTVLAQLTEGQIINADHINFDSLMKDASPFLTRDQNRQRYLVAKMNVLASMISQMNGIQRATVVLDQPEGQIGMGRAHVPPSASVTVLTRTEELTQQQVDAIAQLVAGSHAGLKPSNVKIINARTGRAMEARTNDLLSASKYLEVKLAAEQHAKATLESALGHIPNVRIAVNAQVDTKEVVQQMSKFGEPRIGITSESSRTITSANAVPGMEPGVRPNTGVNLAVGGRSGSQLSDERAEMAGIPVVDKTNSQIRDAKGYALQINAAIGVPKSYFERLYQDRQGDNAQPPDPAALDALVQEETEKIKQYITPLIDTQALDGAMAGTVTVSMIPDFGYATGFGQPEAVLASLGGLAEGAISDGLVKYITLGGLAVLSLAMMFMMVRRASVREDLPTAAELVGIPPALAAAESDLVGEADEAAPALEGLELNDDAIRRQQMLQQITEMVNSSPEEAASLLRRWIKSET